MSALNWISTANAQPPNHLTWVLSSARIGASDPQRPRISIHQNQIAMGLRDYTFLAYRVVVPLRCPAQQVVLRPAASRSGWCVAAPRAASLHRTGSRRRRNRSAGYFRCKNKLNLD
jgi:hypothetical protein